MSAANVRCLFCEEQLDSDSVRNKYGGACPHCLGAFALDGLLSSPGPTPVPSGGEFGKFILTDRLGKGGMGEVWKAFDKELKRWVALKFLRGESPQELARFQREARTAAALSHPGIAAIYEVGETIGRHYIAMQYVEGRTLQMHPRKDRKGLARLIRDAARALEHAHRHGVIHRDLKPENLIVEKTETETRVLILDFGLAKRIQGGESLSKSGTVAGTLAYMSPEQARGEKLDERSDVYSLGATLYEVLTGKPPFEGANAYEIMRRIEDQEPTTPRRLNQHIPHDLETITLKCLEKDKERRYESAKDLGDDLDRFLEGDAVMARRASTWYRVRLRLVKSRAVVMTAATAVMILAVCLGWWVFVGSPSTKYDKRYAEAMGLWADLLRSVGVGGDPAGIENRARKAREAMDRAIEVKETDEALLIKARALHLEGKANEALKALERAYERNRSHSIVQLELARTLLMKHAELRGRPESSGRLGTDQDSLYVRQLTPESTELGHLRSRAEALLEGSRETLGQHKLLLGLLARANGRYAHAAGLLSSYWKEERWDVDALSLEAFCRFFAGDHEGCGAALDLLIDRVPKAEHYYYRGLVKYVLNHLDDAIADFDLSIQLRPDAGTYCQRGDAKAAKGEFSEAIVDHLKAIELEPGNATFLANYAVTLQLGGRLEEAIRNYDRAIDLDPSYVDAYNGRGTAKLILRKPVEAIEDFTKAIDLDPKFSTAFSNRGGARRELRQFEPGMADLNKAIELDPRSTKAYFNKGLLQLDRGLFDAAIRDFDRAIELNPKYADSYNSRGNAKAALRLRAESILDYDKAIELNPNDDAAYVNRSASRFELGQYAEALNDCNQAISRNPNRLDAHYNRGLIHEAMGHESESIRDFKKALGMAPPDWPGCEVALERINAPAARDAYSKGMELYKSGDYQGSISQLGKVVTWIPRAELATLASYNLSCCYAVVGEKANALTWLERAVEKGYKDVAHIEKDSDLDSIRSEERFKTLVAKLKGAR